MKKLLLEALFDNLTLMKSSLMLPWVKWKNVEKSHERFEAGNLVVSHNILER